MIGRAISHYRVIEKLGAGGMGVVYKAEDMRLHRLVALKFLPDATAHDVQALARFRREAQSASALNHSNICTIYELGEESGSVFIAMELLEGRSLDVEIRGRRPALDRMLQIGIDLANGLEAAHNKGIVHRDIKPANLFLTVQGQLKILDFGLARPRRAAQAAGNPDAETLPPSEIGIENLTSPGAAVGTVAYMSPEQASGEELDERTDIFSAGAVLYELASGRPPFAGKTTAKIFDAILNREPAPLEDHTLPSELIRIVSKCLEKDRDLRYQHAGDLRADLKRLKRDLGSDVAEKFKRSGVSGRFSVSPSARAAVERPARKLTAAVIALLLVCLVAAGGYLWRREKTVVKPEPREIQLTNNAPEAAVRAAAISPDGKRLAYVDPEGLIVRTLRTGDILPIPLPDDFAKRLRRITWAQDGTALLGQASLSAEQNSDSGLWLIPLLGAASPRLIRKGCYFSVSPDRSMLAFEDDCNQQPIWISNANGEGARRLEPLEDDFVRLSKPVWSPDNKWVAYIRAPRSKREDADWSGSFLYKGNVTEYAVSTKEVTIQIRPVEGGPSKTVFSVASLADGTRITPFADVTWLPDWRLIFSVHESEDWKRTPSTGNESIAINSPEIESLWFVSIDPRSTRALQSGHLAGAWPDVSLEPADNTADGKKLAWIMRRRSSLSGFVGDLGTAHQPLTKPRKLTLVDADNSPDAWTRDSKAVVISAERNGKSGLFRQPLSGGPPETIASRGGNAVFTPDATWMLFVFDDSKPGEHGTPELMRIPTAGGPQEKIADLEREADSEPICPPQRASGCILQTKSGTILTFSSLDPLRGKGEELGRITISPTWLGTSVASDGSKVALMQWGEGGRIQILDFRTKALSAIKLANPFSFVLGLAWAVDGKSLYVSGTTEKQEKGFDVTRVSMDGKIELLWHADSFVSDLLPSPDGKHLAFAEQSQTDSNVWMLEDF